MYWGLSARPGGTAVKVQAQRVCTPLSAQAGCGLGGTNVPACEGVAARPWRPQVCGLSRGAAVDVAWHLRLGDAHDGLWAMVEAAGGRRPRHIEFRGGGCARNWAEGSRQDRIKGQPCM